MNRKCLSAAPKCVHPGLQRGFTLIELMVVVVMIAILVAVAFPSYQNSIMKSRRVIAKTALLDIAAREEKYFSVNNVYTANLTGSNSLGLASADLQDGNGQIVYRLSLVADNTSNPPTFTATATPQGQQAKDSCGAFTINNYGQQTPNKPGCW